jgi:glycosyltransferase involved in cell wall biosynthesis
MVMLTTQRLSIKMSTVTVIIPVRNEAKNLEKCIRAVESLGKVLVVDSSSTDQTCEIGRRLGAEVIDFEWNGKFPKKRNWVLRNYEFDSEWVLFLDADEFVSQEFVGEVQKKISNTANVGFWLNFENHFMGKSLRWGDRMRKLALFRPEAGEYERIEEDCWSTLDMEVHEHPLLDGSLGEIKATIEHRDYRGLHHYLSKHNDYGNWEAERYLKLRSNGISTTQLTKRQVWKYTHLSKWWFAPAYGVSIYLFKQGFRDGFAGLCFSIMKTFYFFQIRLKIKERQSR